MNCKDKRRVVVCLNERKFAQSPPKSVRGPIMYNKVKFPIKRKDLRVQKDIKLN